MVGAGEGCIWVAVAREMPVRFQVSVDVTEGA